MTGQPCCSQSLAQSSIAPRATWEMKKESHAAAETRQQQTMNGFMF
jgi:hypothetical protein